MPSIEDIILQDDRRGVAALREHLPADFCNQTALAISDEPGTVLIATGFYITMAGAAESDGPPGALAMGRGLESLGWQAHYVTDKYTAPLFGPFLKEPSQLVEFPITSDDESREYASDLLSRLKPSLLIAIERCGLTKDDTYLNMRGVDITSHTARLDHLFLEHPLTIGIGDGGNEIGMGNLAQFIPEVGTLPSNPTTTGATHLIIASTSNWGAYGLMAALSLKTRRNLLPNMDEEDEMIRQMVSMGAVDGTTGANAHTVDGMSLEEHGRALSLLNGVLADQGIPS